MRQAHTDLRKKEWRLTMPKIQKSEHRSPLKRRAPLKVEVHPNPKLPTGPINHKTDKTCMEKGQAVHICGKTLYQKLKFGDGEKSEVSMLN